MQFPVDCNLPRERTEFAYSAQEKLRLIHNGMGRWFREGLTPAQWNKLPVKLQNRYPYKAQLSREEWDDFTENVFEPISEKIVSIILTYREQLKNSTAWQIDVTDEM